MIRQILGGYLADHFAGYSAEDETTLERMA